jgi:hypothetical protein
MSNDHWRREDPQFYNFMGLPRGTPHGAEWGDKVGRGTASAFRGSWQRKAK